MHPSEITRAVARHVECVSARMQKNTLQVLSNDQLVAELQDACTNVSRENVRILLYLVEVENRRLHLIEACTSMFDFCVNRLGMSEGAAYLRIGCARLVRRFPMLTEEIASGGIHMSTLLRLRDYLTEDNVDELLEASRGKNKQQVLELLAARTPQADQPANLRKLPTLKTANAVEAALERDIEAIAEMRYRLGLTMSRDERDEFLYVRDLMMHRNPTGDLNKVFMTAVRALRKELEREVLARPRKAPADANARAPLAKTSGKVREATRRFVFKRDGYRCTFENASGTRCPGRKFLECDHIIVRALGGTDEPDNLRTRCRAHNRLYAEQVFGAEFISAKIRSSQLKSANRKAAKAAAEAAAP